MQRLIGTNMTRWHVLILFLAGATSALPVAAQTAQNPLPNSELKDPVGKQVQFRFQTLPTSVQIYTCRAAGDSFAWVSDPDAIMTNHEKTLLVHHYKGPVWEATDGSLVRGDGPQATHYQPRNQDAIHWLELPVKSTAGQFAAVSLIRRIDTTGGLLPAGKPCDGQHAGDQERVNYSATYLFYTTVRP